MGPSTACVAAPLLRAASLAPPALIPPAPLSRSYAPQWDRDPYVFDSIVDGSLTTTKAMDVLSRNFIIANYNSLGAVDNDDVRAPLSSSPFPVTFWGTNKLTPFFSLA